MRYINHSVVLQEVPNEVSLCFTISGCPLRCDGCHSSYTWKGSIGKDLSISVFHNIIEDYIGLCSCVVFMGGEWEEEHLIKLLDEALHMGFSTCLYTGLDEISSDIKSKLTYLKLGKWNKELGGLNNPSTNQRFIEIKTGNVLNHLFLNK